LGKTSKDNFLPKERKTIVHEILGSSPPFQDGAFSRMVRNNVQTALGSSSPSQNYIPNKFDSFS
jgi:hypothetical protein